MEIYEGQVYAQVKYFHEEEINGSKFKMDLVLSADKRIFSVSAGSSLEELADGIRRYLPRKNIVIHNLSEETVERMDYKGQTQVRFKRPLTQSELSKFAKCLSRL